MQSRDTRRENEALRARLVTLHAANPAHPRESRPRRGARRGGGERPRARRCPLRLRRHRRRGGRARGLRVLGRDAGRRVRTPRLRQQRAAVRAPAWPFGPLRLSDLAGYVRALGIEPAPTFSRIFQSTPMRHRGSEVGHVFLAEKTGGEAFTEEDEEVLTLFASQAASAIANARTHRAERRSRVDLEALTEPRRSGSWCSIRWSEYRPPPVMSARPAHHDNDVALAHGTPNAGVERGVNVDRLICKMLEVYWRDDANLANRATLAGLGVVLGMDAAALPDVAVSLEVQALYTANTEEAIARSLFGFPAPSSTATVPWPGPARAGRARPSAIPSPEPGARSLRVETAARAVCSTGPKRHLNRNIRPAIASPSLAQLGREAYRLGHS